MFNGGGRAVPAAEASRQPAARLSLASRHLSGCPCLCPCPGSSRCCLRGALGADVGSGRPGTRVRCSRAAGPRVAADQGAARQEETGTGAGTRLPEPPSAHPPAAAPCPQLSVLRGCQSTIQHPAKSLGPSEGPAATPARCTAPRGQPQQGLQAFWGAGARGRGTDGLNPAPSSTARPLCLPEQVGAPAPRLGNGPEETARSPRPSPRTRSPTLAECLGTQGGDPAGHKTPTGASYTPHRQQPPYFSGLSPWIL